ncbi:hypothetical protein BD413DRAFT_472502 [Trametes elegans]|nr:hypothetical protein BD413DRAFT_472502 [Trametes elegans]
MRATAPSLPSEDFVNLVRLLPRRQAALLFQLRTGHIPLAVHLHRINCAESAQCLGCGGGEETVEHFLLQCPRYEAEQRRFLGPWGGPARDMGALLNSMEALKPLFQFIGATWRFHARLGALELKTDPAKTQEDERKARKKRANERTKELNDT